METLTKADLVDVLFERLGMTKCESAEMVDTFFDLMRNALIEGEAVKLYGFGNFQVRDKAQRPGRNPRTGDSVEIKARRVVTFHANEKLKMVIDSNYKKISRNKSNLSPQASTSLNAIDEKPTAFSW